jgi:hypothetical protein
LPERAGYLTAEHGHLVAKHHKLDGEIVAFRAAEPEQLEDADERHVEECQGHSKFRRPIDTAEGPAQRRWMDFSAPTRCRFAPGRSDGPCGPTMTGTMFAPSWCSAVRGDGLHAPGRTGGRTSVVLTTSH